MIYVRKKRVFSKMSMGKIVGEEEIKNYINNNLDKFQKKPFIWDFLNSTFGIFLMSSVVITGASKIYSDHKAYVERRESDYRQLAALVTEFDYRTREAEYIARRLSEPNMTYLDRQGHGQQLRSVVVGDNGYHPTSPEFQNIHWLSIAMRMRLIYPEVRSDNIQDTIFWIETGKNSQWIYDVKGLKERTPILRRYIDSVSTQYIKDSGRSVE